MASKLIARKNAQSFPSHRQNVEKLMFAILSEKRCPAEQVTKTPAHSRHEFFELLWGVRKDRAKWVPYSGGGREKRDCFTAFFRNLAFDLSLVPWLSSSCSLDDSLVPSIRRYASSQFTAMWENPDLLHSDITYSGHMKTAEEMADVCQAAKVFFDCIAGHPLHVKNAASRIISGSIEDLEGLFSEFARAFHYMLPFFGERAEREFSLFNDVSVNAFFKVVKKTTLADMSSSFSYSSWHGPLVSLVQFLQRKNGIPVSRRFPDAEAFPVGRNGCEYVFKVDECRSEGILKPEGRILPPKLLGKCANGEECAAQFRYGEELFCVPCFNYFHHIR